MWRVVCALLAAAVVEGARVNLNERIDTLLEDLEYVGRRVGQLALPDFTTKRVKASDVRIGRVGSWERVGDVEAQFWTPKGRRESANLTALIELSDPVVLRVGRLKVKDSLPVPVVFTVAEVLARFTATILDHNRPDTCSTTYSDFRLTQLTRVTTRSPDSKYDKLDLSKEFTKEIMPFMNNLLIKLHFAESLTAAMPLCPFF